MLNIAAQQNLNDWLKKHTPANLAKLRLAAGVWGQETLPLAPALINKKDIEAFTSKILTLHSILASIPARRFSGDIAALCRHYGLPSKVSDVLIKSNLRLPSPHFRPDCMLSEGRLRVLEMNVDSGSTTVTHGQASRSLFSSLGLLSPWASEQCTSLQTYAADRMLAEHLQKLRDKSCRPLWLWSAERKDPFVAGIANSLSAYLQRLGLNCKIVESEDILESTLSELPKVFRLFGYPRLMKNDRLWQANLRLTEAGCSAESGVESFIYDSKANLAVLHEEEFQSTLSTTERKIINELVPWSARITANGTSTSWYLERRETLVIKSFNDFQGQGVYIGRDTTEANWAELVDSSMRSGGYIVQTLATPDQIPMPYYSKSLGFHELPSTLVISPQFIDGRFAGCLTRLGLKNQAKVAVADGKDSLAGISATIST